MQNIDNDLLFDEFVHNQPMCGDDISADAWAEAEVVDGKEENENKIVHYHIDVLWHFKWLPLFLYYPTGMQVWNNYSTNIRSSLKLDGTLSRLLKTKTYNPECLNLCYKWRQDKILFDLSKKTTITYNNEQTQKKNFVFDCYLS